MLELKLLPLLRVTAAVRVKLTLLTVLSPNSLLSTGAFQTVLAAVGSAKLPQAVAPVGGVQDQLTLVGVLLSETMASTKVE